MARRYPRDNRGRFAGGGGATARGGRLKTAAGNKRKTQTMQAGGAKAAGTIKGRVKRDPGAAGKAGKGKASVATAAKKRIAVTTFKTNTDLGRRGIVSMSARAKVRRSQNVKSLATEKGKEVLDRIQGAGFRRGSRETKYNAPGSAGAKRIAKTAATQSRAKAFAQQQVYNKGGGAYRGQRPEFNWKRSRAKLNRRTVAKSAPSAAAIAQAGREKRASTKGARLGGTRRTTRAAAPANTAANRTGQSKTLNKFNSRPVGTMVAGKGINLVPSTKRVPLNIAQKASDRAFAGTATKAARTRALIPAKTQQKQTTAQRATRAATNQSRVTQAVLAKSSRRPTRKQRRSILTAESAKRFYATKAVDYLKVNAKKPGFRLPRGMR
jgi:hypothetical protein